MTLAGEPPQVGRKILNLSFGQDTGGQQWRLSQAWPRYRPNDRYLSITRQKTFYPIQHEFHRSSVPVRWAESDVIHLHGDLHYRKRLRVPDKPMVMNHHGSQFRTRPEYHLEELRKTKAVAIASTVDLHWLKERHPCSCYSWRRRHADSIDHQCRHASEAPCDRSQWL